MAKIAKRKKPSASVITRKMNQFAWESADDPEAGRLSKVYQAVGRRMKAKKLGKEAAVLIAKARKAKIKKAELTKTAKSANRKAQSMSGGINTVLKSAENKNFRKRTKINSGVWLDRKNAIKNLRKYDPENPAFAKAYEYKQKQDEFAKISKAAARRSGGTATGIKRTAEAAISRIATGKAMKGMARAGGALGIAAMFTAALSGKDSKKKRG